MNNSLTVSPTTNRHAIAGYVGSCLIALAMTFAAVSPANASLEDLQGEANKLAAVKDAAVPVVIAVLGLSAGSVLLKRTVFS